MRCGGTKAPPYAVITSKEALHCCCHLSGKQKVL